ncbi:MAG TPA: acyltransferase [Oculatellaceae cyanobacterium]|jgi:acetyltransferase-like isoleucine patch superfamily enzyme
MKPIKLFFDQIPEFFGEALLSSIRGNRSRIASYLRKKVYNTECLIDTDVVITNKNNFKSGAGSCLYHSCYILNNNGNFSIGNNSHLAAFCYINVCYGNILIGDDVAIGPGTNIIAYSNYYEVGKKVTDSRITQDVKIMNNVFIGANCTILPGTIIHDNVVIGAGSIVKGELAENSVYVGVPSRVIKSGWYE